MVTWTYPQKKESVFQRRGGGDAGEVPAPQPGVQDIAPQQQLGTALEDTWVTVFGMGPEHLPLVLQEFQNCGNILQFGSFGAPKDVNWIHLKFEAQHAAQRALARNGEQLAKGLVIGVKPVSPLHRQAISSFLGSGYADAPPPTVPLAVRRHRMDDSARQVASLPQSSKSMLGYLSEVIWGA